MLFLLTFFVFFLIASSLVRDGYQSGNEIDLCLDIVDKPARLKHTTLIQHNDPADILC